MFREQRLELRVEVCFLVQDEIQVKKKRRKKRFSHLEIV